MLEYGIGARDLLPGLDDEAVEAIFDEVVDLHADAQRRRKREETVGRLRSRMGVRRG